jgi:hypothetical protein
VSALPKLRECAWIKVAANDSMVRGEDVAWLLGYANKHSIQKLRTQYPDFPVARTSDKAPATQQHFRVPRRPHYVVGDLRAWIAKHYPGSTTPSTTKEQSK